MSTELDTINHMSSSLDVLPPARSAAASAIAMLREHAEVMQIAYGLAEAMCRTALVPDRFRGKAQDAAAAILYGAELGLNPIQSLQRVIPIYGSPTLEARTMVALLQARGYKIRTISQSDESVTVEGCAPDGEHTQSTWTMQRAIKAKYVPEIDERTGKYKTNAKGNLIGNEKYLTDPQAMLKAKAQAEVCRDLAPEILLGISYTVEELESERRNEHHKPAPVEAITVDEIIGAGLTAQRQGQSLRDKVKDGNPGGWTGRDGGNEVLGAQMSSGAEPSTGQRDQHPATHPAELSEPPGGLTDSTPGQTERVASALAKARDEIAFTPAQRSKGLNTLFGLFGDADIDRDNRIDRLIVLEHIIGAPVNSSNDLTDPQLFEVVNALRGWKDTGRLGSQVTDVLNAAALRQMEAEETDPESLETGELR